jgi:hypothetical protein
MKKSRSSLFAHPASSINDISEGFYGIQVGNSEGVYPRTLPRTSSPTWGSQSDVTFSITNR